MPIYEFENKRTGEVIEEYFSMTEVPPTVHKDGKVYQRKFSTTSAVHIPLEFTQNRPDYSKSPSRKKHVY